MSITINRIPYGVMHAVHERPLRLAASKDNGPTVIQVRTQNVMPNVIGSIVVKAINEFMAEIQSGALISIDAHKSRVRILPFE